MNAALLIVSSALAAGGDVIPAGWGEPPLVVQAGCSSCAAAPVSSCGCAKARGMDRFRGHFAGKSSGCCDPCAGSGRMGLFDKMKGAFGHKKSHSCCGPIADPCCGAVGVPGCAAPAAPGAVTPPVTPAPPKEMPKLKDTPKSDTPPVTPKPTGSVSIPPVPGDPAGLPIPPAPTPVVGTSPY